jgi:vacuolar protein sorting-associated protein 13A/C
MSVIYYRITAIFDGLQAAQIHQHIFELNFRVERLSATISKTLQDGTLKQLGIVSLGRFSLNFILEQYTMQVNINLRCVAPL